MCMTCGCVPCVQGCPTLTMTMGQQAIINTKLAPMLKAQGFHLYLTEDEGGMKHLCITDSVDPNGNIDTNLGNFPFFS